MDDAQRRNELPAHEDDSDVEGLADPVAGISGGAATDDIDSERDIDRPERLVPGDAPVIDPRVSGGSMGGGVGLPGLRPEVDERR